MEIKTAVTFHKTSLRGNTFVIKYSNFYDGIGAYGMKKYYAYDVTITAHRYDVSTGQIGKLEFCYEGTPEERFEGKLYTGRDLMKFFDQIVEFGMEHLRQVANGWKGIKDVAEFWNEIDPKALEELQEIRDAIANGDYDMKFYHRANEEDYEDKLPTIDSEVTFEGV